MAAPGRISAGRAGLAESALLPDEDSQESDVKDIYRFATVTITGARLVRKEMAGPAAEAPTAPCQVHEPRARSRSRSMRTAARRNSATDAIIDAGFRG